MDLVRDHLYGGIYSEDYQEFSDGGPKCYEDMDYYFRLSLAALSVAVNLVLICKQFTLICLKPSLSSQFNDLQSSIFQSPSR
jgi:hypothetical protein